MKEFIAVFLFLPLLAACGGSATTTPDPLSEAECRALVRKELDIAMQALPREQAAAFADATAQGMEGEVRKCTADRTISRTYHACMLAAKTIDEAKPCIAAERGRR